MRRSVLRFGIAAILLSGLVVISNGNILQNGFVWDDNEQIVMNPDLRSSAPLMHLFSSDVWGGRSIHAGNYYRPFQMWTYRITAAVGGFDPFAFHLLSVLFAVITVVAALGFFWQLAPNKDVAFVASALFAVYPIHTEAVDWVSALPDIGCTLFVLAGFTLFLLGRPGDLRPAQPTQSPQTHVLALALSAGCFVAALLWKETAAVFPLLVAVYVLLLPFTNGLMNQMRSAAKLSFPYWLVLIGYLILRHRVLGHLAMSQRNWVLTPFEFGLTAGHLMTAYWWKLVMPTQLNAYYVFSPIMSLSDARAITGILFVVIACTTIVYGTRRLPLVSFGILWVFISLLPVMDVYAVGRNAFAERYLYLPSVGFCLLVATSMVEVSKWIPQRIRVFSKVSVIAAIVILFASETIARNSDWKDNATLFARTLETSPNAPFVENMVASTQPDDNSGLRSAETHYLRAISLSEAEVPPDRLQMTFAHKGLASIYTDRSDFVRALDQLEQVRSIDPADAEVDGKEGLTLAKAGRWDEAETHLNRAIAASHGDENVANAMGIVEWQHNHQPDSAAAYFLRALTIHTANDDFSASVRNNLGTVYGEEGSFSAAIEQFKSAIAIVPSDPEYHTNLATAFAASGKYDDARSEIRAALAIAPNYEPARALLKRMSGR